MRPPGWLTRSLADVPDGDAWVGPAERRCLAGLRFERRRADWRLGRWTAKAAVGAWLGCPASDVQVLAAPDGAPEAWVNGERAPVSVSLSHRGGRAFAVVVDAPAVVGCDLERVEPRSGAFVREWLSAAEQQALAGRDGAGAARLANLMWSSKEATAKVLREGLRLDVRHAVTTPDLAGEGAWRRVRVVWPHADGEPRPMAGWWRDEPGWVLVVAAVPAPDVPQPIG